MPLVSFEGLIPPPPPPLPPAAGLPQLEGDSAFLWDALAARRTVFTDMSLFVRFNQRLENIR